jgi:hypothetical protein
MQIQSLISCVCLAGRTSLEFLLIDRSNPNMAPWSVCRPERAAQVQRCRLV